MDLQNLEDKLKDLKIIRQASAEIIDTSQIQNFEEVNNFKFSKNYKYFLKTP